MKGEYHIDLKSISLFEYEEELERTELIASRRIIKEGLKERFAVMREYGVENLDDLMTVLKTPVKMKTFSMKTGLPEEYLVILKREIASNQPKPINLNEFPGISKTAVEQLEKLKIRNTIQLYDHIKTESARSMLCDKTGIPYDEILELAKLTDVARIKWVGANFARLLVDSECDTVDKVTKADYQELYGALMIINEKKNYFKGKFGLNDMKLCVAAAKNVPDTIRFNKKGVKS